MVLRTSRALDGRGGALANVDIVVEQGRIARIVPAGTATGKVIDLRGVTVLPGLIDAHVHLDWYFNRKGRFHTRGDGDTPGQSMLAAAANAYATLMDGFTTVQSLGANVDADLREYIATQGLPGPRLLTSLDAFNENSGGPDSLRALIRLRKSQGADAIKLFASKSIRDGGAQTMTDAQLVAACGEAKALGLRSIVHAHSAASMKAAANAGCNQIEHGVLADQEALDLVAAKGMYFDPQCSLVFRNYLDNRAKYNGIGNYNEEGFASMEKALPLGVGGDPKGDRDARDEARVRHRRGGRRARAQRRGSRVPGAAGRPEADGRAGLGDVAERRVAGAREVDRGAGAGMEADIIAVDGDPSSGHHGGAAGGVCDEIGEDLQERAVGCADGGWRMTDGGWRKWTTASGFFRGPSFVFRAGVALNRSCGAPCRAGR